MRFASMAALAAVLAGGPTALAAPVPAMKKAAPPAAGSLPPRLAAVPAAVDGKVKLPPVPTPAGTVVFKVAVPGGPALPVGQGDDADGVTLDQVKDLAVVTAGGDKVTVEEAAKRLKGGGVVAISADGKPIDPAYLASLSSDTLVLTAPGLAAKDGGAVRVNGAVRVIQIAPAVPAPVAPPK